MKTCQFCEKCFGTDTLTCFDENNKSMKVVACRECLELFDFYCVVHDAPYIVKKINDTDMTRTCSVCAREEIEEIDLDYINKLIEFLKQNKADLVDKTLTQALSEEDCSVKTMRHMLHKILINAGMFEMTLEQGVVYQLDGRNGATLH